MKRLSILTLAIIAICNLNAQNADTTKVSSWKLKGAVGLNMSQTTLTNWSAGGDNSFAGAGYLNGNLEHKANNWTWLNTLVLEYGVTTTKTKGMQKNTDRLELATQLGYSTDNIWYYTAMADFKTQFYKGYSDAEKTNIMSDFLSPAYSNISIGIEYKPNGKFYSLYYSPAAGKLTYVKDKKLSSEGAFGVDKGKHFRGEFGTYFKAKAEKGIMENVKLITDASFFTAYNKSFGNIDVDWNMLISMKINKFMNASISTTLRYDDDVKYIAPNSTMHGPRVQFKEIIAVGFGYNF